MTALLCPNCAGQMRSTEPDGITIDQCTDCRGIFLDQGDLERLDGEDAHDGGSARGRRQRAGSRDDDDMGQDDPRRPFRAEIRPARCSSIQGVTMCGAF